VRVFLDTNVLVSAFATRGLCADLLRHVLAEQTLVVGEVVLDELRRVLRDRIGVPPDVVETAEELLREHEVVPASLAPAAVEMRDESDRWVLAAALDGGAEVVVSGDRDLLDLGESAPLPIVSPRGFWDRLRADDTT